MLTDCTSTVASAHRNMTATGAAGMYSGGLVQLLEGFIAPALEEAPET